MLWEADLPVLDIGNRQGHTNYIDFIHWNELKYPVMKGCDMFGRPFVVMRLVGITSTGEVRFYCQTFFQRYSDSSNPIMPAGNRLITSSGPMTDSQIETVDKIIAGKTVELNYLSVLKNSQNRVFCCHYGIWLKKKANIIKRNWLLVRYNPRFKMAEKVLFRNLDSIENS